MLKLNGESFTTGRARFTDSLSEGAEPTSKIYVKISVHCAGRDLTLSAQLDTGAAWSMLNAEVAEAMGLFEEPGESISISTRIGLVSGKLVRVLLVILADEGVSLDVDATAFVCRDWLGPNLLGYSGLLEHLRIAIDPGREQNHFYFGRTS